MKVDEFSGQKSMADTHGKRRGNEVLCSMNRDFQPGMRGFLARPMECVLNFAEVFYKNPLKQ
ncbi:MAG: hypothetical protein Q8S08_09210 [Halomonas sp.]|nr:hypothetical protein [Halomonas sp.]MDP3535556.1 hypothetical protein [Halomonas sp.]